MWFEFRWLAMFKIPCCPWRGIQQQVKIIGISDHIAEILMKQICTRQQYTNCWFNLTNHAIWAHWITRFFFNMTTCTVNIQKEIFRLQWDGCYQRKVPSLKLYREETNNQVTDISYPCIALLCRRGAIREGSPFSTQDKNVQKQNRNLGCISPLTLSQGHNVNIALCSFWSKENSLYSGNSHVFSIQKYKLHVMI